MTLRMMIPRSSRYALFHALAVMLVAGACAKAPPPPALPPITIAAPAETKTKSAMVLAASADTNPDATGRPLGCRARYQMKTDAAFKGADFLTLRRRYERSGPELISRDGTCSRPRSARRSSRVYRDTRFVGARPRAAHPERAMRGLYRTAQWANVPRAGPFVVSAAVED